VFSIEVFACGKENSASRFEPFQHNDRQEIRDKVGGLRTFKEPVKFLEPYEFVRGDFSVHLSGNSVKPEVRRQGRHLVSRMHHLRTAHFETTLPKQQPSHARQKSTPFLKRSLITTVSLI
jgi:hypothetical protein